MKPHLRHLLRLHSTLLLSSAIGSFGAHASSGAQSISAPAPTSVIDGYISDAELTPIADAAVSLLGRSVHVVTRENGRFRITGLAAGTYVVVANRLGYTPATVRVELSPGDTARPSIELEHNAPMLDTMKVIAANRPSARMAEFEQRRKLGIGQSLNATEIDRRNTPWMQELLRSFLGVRFSNNSGVPLNARVGIIRDCPFKFFLDGVARPTPRSIEDEFPPTKDLAGIEVFTSVASVPPQYATSDGGGFCGAILIWTKVGPPAGEP
jgi:hypothetical protein